MQRPRLITMLKWPRRRFATTLVLATMSATVMCLAVLATISITLARDADEQRLRQALDVSAELELLVDLHLAANTDFLKSVGSAAFESRAWPIGRAVMVARAYNHLDSLLADSPLATSKLTELRKLSGRWPKALQDAAQNVALAAHGTAVDSDRLLRVNESLKSIMDILASLRSDERDQIAGMQEKAQGQILKQRIALVVGLATGMLLLIFAVSSRHRSVLAKSAARIAAEEAQKRFSQYFDQHPVAMLIFEVGSGAILTANAAALRQYKATLEQLNAMIIEQLRPAEEVAAFRRDFGRYVQSGADSGSGGIRRHCRIDGEVIFVDVSFHLLSFGGRDACFITAHDVTAHETAKEQLHIRSRALEAARDAIVISHLSSDAHRIAYANTAFERLTGHRVDQVIGAPAQATFGWDQTTPESESLQRAKHDNREVSQLVSITCHDGSTFWSDTYVGPILDETGRPTHCITVLGDVSERVRYQDQLKQQASEDSLTGLPNRLALGQCLSQAVDLARRRGDTLGLIFLDLDNFKEVNDSLGHAAGDDVLREVSRRLRSSVMPPGLVARYAGDEFVVLLPGETHEQCIEHAQRIKAVLARDMKIGDTTLAPEGSMGIAFYPGHGVDAESLLRAADAAMYRSKSIGAGSIQVFDPEIAAEDAARAAMTRALELAIARNELFLLYQPKVCLRTRQVQGFEALLRWQSSEFGLVSPAQFIPLAESSGLIVQIGEWVLEQACLQACAWSSLYAEVVIAVNISPVQFERSDVPEMVARTLLRSEVNPRNIELEITESTLMAPEALPALHALRRLNVSIAIDDFGTGFSSLGYVRSFMADRLKLDMSFVRGIGVSRADEVIVKAVIAMGQALDIRVVAEGVETADQLDYLLGNGCDEVQGFWFGRPMRPEAAVTLLIGNEPAANQSDIEPTLFVA
ncbi:diguanylate cyclase/phosphodiesterase (GGDEF & EAL domain) with PAS/PAC sensor(s) [Candidatus Burkholderia verschuerenii]|uniref:Diguanylate cyclase/phosphodiesterase (GGDEF & EAL domain) with PAS/PAC sensor(S) n=1 Tax=Candidatus Burkholderia verschuerenii TaxID=242163 RepID=A0A0L0M6P9_9BURK|nr:EAL domain-containing protein [Candidatus Burkholderia verschuerenii]KND57975.1 diguanylate cyclase/phosphodiesterase (GGDEF & EAL domain) with PAS/PAC sensor(s) [Candidatus Burkholderia verschuerenii]